MGEKGRGERAPDEAITYVVVARPNGNGARGSRVVWTDVSSAALSGSHQNDQITREKGPGPEPEPERGHKSKEYNVMAADVLPFVKLRSVLFFFPELKFPRP